MRDIKFRAWDKEHHFFVGVNAKITLDGRMILHSGEKPINETCYLLEQYTGLKDKNGKEIYEGDIVKYIEDDFYNDMPDIVEVDLSHAMANGTIEVIGNIHENPEMLK